MKIILSVEIEMDHGESEEDAIAEMAEIVTSIVAPSLEAGKGSGRSDRVIFALRTFQEIDLLEKTNHLEERRKMLIRKTCDLFASYFKNWNDPKVRELCCKDFSEARGFELAEQIAILYRFCFEENDFSFCELLCEEFGPILLENMFLVTGLDHIPGVYQLHNHKTPAYPMQPLGEEYYRRR